MLSKEECKIVIGATLSGLVGAFGKDLVQKNTLDAYYILRGAIKNTDVPPMEQVFDYENSVVVVRVVGALARGLTQLTEAGIVVSALGELARDEVYWRVCEAVLKTQREQFETLKQLGMTNQDVVDKIRKDIEKQGGIGPYDRVAEEGEEWKLGSKGD